MLSNRVLVLNRNYLPIQITSVKRAFLMLYQDIARVIDEQYQLYDFQSWSELAVEAHHDAVGLVDRMIRVPRVILLQLFDKAPRRIIRFSRLNIYRRDQNRCQYCGEVFAIQELNLDHVIPRSQGGVSSWENVVCSCIECNRKKGGRTPLQAGIKLIKKPTRPNWNLFADFKLSNPLYEAWKPFLNMVDFTYWNLEIES